jgi:hypothetical protein
MILQGEKKVQRTINVMRIVELIPYHQEKFHYTFSCLQEEKQLIHQAAQQMAIEAAFYLSRHWRIGLDPHSLCKK